MQRRQGARARESRHAAAPRLEVGGEVALHRACRVHLCDYPILSFSSVMFILHGQREVALAARERDARQGPSALTGCDQWRPRLVDG
jgi:hypothetical protein